MLWDGGVRGMGGQQTHCRGERRRLGVHTWPKRRLKMHVRHCLVTCEYPTWSAFEPESNAYMSLEEEVSVS